MKDREFGLARVGGLTDSVVSRAHLGESKSIQIIRYCFALSDYCALNVICERLPQKLTRISQPLSSLGYPLVKMHLAAYAVVSQVLSKALLDCTSQ